MMWRAGYRELRCGDRISMTEILDGTCVWRWKGNSTTLKHRAVYINILLFLHERQNLLITPGSSNPRSEIVVLELSRKLFKFRWGYKLH